MKELRNYLTTFFSGAATKLAALLLGLSLEIVIAKSLGVHDYGVYSFGIAVLGIFILFISRGATNNIIRFGAQLIEKDQVATRTFVKWNNSRAFVNFLIFLPFALLVIPILERTNSAMNASVYLLMIVAALVVCFTQIHQAFFQSMRDSLRAQAYDDIIRPLVMIILLVVCIYLFKRTPTVEDLALFYVVGALIAFAFSLRRAVTVLYRVLPSPVNDSQKPDTVFWVQSARELFRFNLVGFVLRRLDIVIVTFLVAASDVGSYKVAIRMSELVALPLWISNLYIGPMISRLFVENKLTQLQHLITLSTRFALFVSLAGSVILYFGSEWILGWFGKGFEGAYPLVIILIIGSLVDVACGPVQLMLVMTGDTRTLIKIQSTAALFTVLLLLLLTWRYGITGAAIAIVSGNSLWNLWLWILIYRRLRLDTSFLPTFRSS